jgi:hypothetical protein
MSSDQRDSDGLPPCEAADVTVSNAIEAARRGNVRAARKLLEEFNYWVDLGEPGDEQVLDYVRIAFLRILDGEDPGTAFNLNRRKGRPSEAIGFGSLKKLIFGRLVADRRAQGATYEEAVIEVAQEANVSDSTVGRGFRKYNKEILRYLRGRSWTAGDLGAEREAYAHWSAEIQRLNRFSDIIERFNALQSEGLSEEASAKQVGAELGMSLQEVEEALAYYDDYLRNLFF